MTTTVQALLFDFGGVIVNIDFNEAYAVWSAFSGVPAAVIASRFAFDSAYEAHERGRLAASEYFAALRRSLDIRLSDAQFTDGWNAILRDEVPGIAALLERLRTRIPLYLFSNSNPTHHACWVRKYAGTLGAFRQVFVSSELGWRKPEPQAFAAVATAMGMAPAHIAFFDDTQINVQGAQAAGMQAHHVKSPADLEHALAATGFA